MTTADFNALAEILPQDQIVTATSQIESLSRDFYWYSPVLKRDLAGKLAEVVVQPRSLEQLKSIVRFAFVRKVAITIRGAGTGNYGQCIPTHGGIVVDLAALDKVFEITEDGRAICEPAARLAVIETTARRSGWELRCYPSTYVKATVAGFCAGGSGGIGSITWGGLRENGTVHALTILTLEAEPQEIRLTGNDIFKVLHAWGTNGIIVGVELRLAPRTNWAQLAVAHDSYAKSFDFIEAIALNESFKKRLVTNFEWPLPSYFTPLQKWVPAGKALAFFEVADDQLERLTNAAVSTGGLPVFVAPYAEPRKGALLSDYTWNHTTLWALKADPSLTYLQCGFSAVHARDQFRQLKAQFGDDILFHVEMTKWEGIVTPGSIPVVRYTTDERLQEMIDACARLGVTVANPHVNFLEGSGRWRPDDAKLVAKQQYDPRGLLNPGKMRGFAASLEGVGEPTVQRPAAMPAYGD
jgi:FAD binding domain